MRAVSLGSGSGGNCTLIESDGTRVLVDAGFGPRETKRRLEAEGVDIEQVDAILITHEHSDHIHGAESISRKFGIPIHLTQGTLDGTRWRRDGLPLKVFENNHPFQVRDLMVHPRRIIHDAADPACYVLEAVDGARLGIASDLGWVDDPTLRHLRNCDALLFESNHDVDMLRQGSYPWSLKRRILSRFGHLSNDDAISALQRIAGPETRAICLIHLSEKNNHDSIVRAMALEMIEKLGAGIELTIAEQKQSHVVEIGARRSPPPPAAGPRQLSLF